MHKKTLSCEALHGSIYFAPDMLRHCCKRFTRNGKLQGDVKIFDVKTQDDITYEKILEKKNKLYKDINLGKDTPCTGCPWLVEDDWKPIEEFKIKHISIEVHSVCNMRCIYCSEVYYGGKQPNYNIKKIINQFIEKNKISNDVSLIWAGGEAVLLRNFEQTFEEITTALKPKNNYIFTNATVYKEIITKYLKKNAVNIVTSIDAGTHHTFKKIRKSDALDKIFHNLERYSSVGKANINVKYILMEENSSKKELQAFVEKIKKHNLTDCTFQISSNYKNNVISNKEANAALFLYKLIKDLGVILINFDDHLMPRIKKIINNKNNKITGSVIIWGAGDYSRMLFKEDKSFIRNRTKFFVDKNPNKQGKEFLGLPVKSPNAIKNHKSCKLIIASALSYKEIYETLIKEYKISPDMIIDNPVI
jgi:poly(ribitol-phosphate) beta-N-acetylglucosaminyltransferase